MFSVSLAISRDIHSGMWNLFNQWYVYFHNNHDKASPEIGKTMSKVFFLINLHSFLIFMRQVYFFQQC